MSRCHPLLVATLAGLPAVAALAASPIIVTQIGRAFSLRELRIKRGDVVRFNNADEFLHQLYVASTTFSFSSAEQEPGRTVEIRFTTAGNFDVRCEIHPRMRLPVSVE